MDKDYWLHKWHNNQIGFHQTKPHTLLTNYFQTLHLTQHARVFVPLCGASIDMFWLLTQSYQVIGVELSPIACEAFFKAHDLAFTVNQQEAFMVYKGENITIFCGDFFKLNQALLGPIDAVYDRAALIALNSEQRLRYVHHLFKLVTSSVKLFIISIDYDASEMAGPPFPVLEAEMQALYGPYQPVQHITSQEIKNIAPHLVEKGLTKASEELYCSVLS